jgi:hypothetical protein
MGKIKRVEDSIFVTNRMKFIAKIPRFLCGTISICGFDLIRGTDCRTICPTYFTDFNWRGIHNKDIGEIRKLAAQGFSDFSM